jgi:hypothetical protein
MPAGGSAGLRTHACSWLENPKAEWFRGKASPPKAPRADRFAQRRSAVRGALYGGSNLVPGALLEQELVSQGQKARVQNGCDPRQDWEATCDDSKVLRDLKTPLNQLLWSAALAEQHPRMADLRKGVLAALSRKGITSADLLRLFCDTCGVVASLGTTVVVPALKAWPGKGFPGQSSVVLTTVRQAPAGVLHWHKRFLAT